MVTESKRWIMCASIVQRTRRIAFVLAMLAASCTSQEALRAPAWQGSVSDEHGVRVVNNPDTGVLDSTQLDLGKAWVFDPGANGSDSLVWIRPSRIMVVRDAFYIVDTPAAHVYVLSMSGEWIQTLGRRGGGPGEFLRPISVVDLGLRTVIIDAGKATAEIFDVAGRYERTIQMGMLAFNAVPLDTASFIVSGIVGNEQRWTVLDTGGGQRPFSFAVPQNGAGSASCLHTTPGIASVLTLRCVTLQLSVYDISGRLQQRINIARDSIMASREQLDRFAADARRQMSSSGLPAPVVQQVMDEQLAAMRVKQLYRKAMQDRHTGMIAIWEQEPADLGNGPATVHWLSADGLYLGASHFATGWVDVALADGQLVALVPSAATDEVQVAAYTLRDAQLHARRTVPTPAMRN